MKKEEKSNTETIVIELNHNEKTATIRVVEGSNEIDYNETIKAFASIKKGKK